MKNAHAMMWQRWQEHIDFEALNDALFDAIGMLYGEYLTAHIDEYQELEAQILERLKRKPKERGPDNRG